MDFYDKLVVSITLVIVTIFCIFANFSLAYSEPLSLSVAPTGYWFSSGSIIQRSDSSTMTYIRVSKGLKYRIVNDTGVPIIAASSFDELKIGSSIFHYVNIESGSEYIYEVVDDVSFVGFIGSSPGTFFPSVYIESEGMPSTISILANNLAFSHLWNVFETGVPYVAVVVVVGFGFYIIIGMIKGLSKGKARL